MSSTSETLAVLGDIKELLAEQISVGETTNRLLNELNTSIDAVLGVSIVRGATSLNDVVNAVGEVTSGVASVDMSIGMLSDS